MRGKALLRRLSARVDLLRQHLRVSHVHGPRQISYSLEELIALSVVRNGELYVRSFIEHHFKLGIKHIVFLDNGSTDRTVEIAAGYPNITILQTHTPYKKYEILMKEYLVRRFSPGRWNLFVDIDELFDYPDSDKLSMKHLLRYLNRYSFGAVVSQMLDLFSDQELRNPAQEDNHDIRAIYRLYDLSSIEKTDYRTGIISNEAIKMHWGGIRKKIFGSHNGLTKAAMTLIDDRIRTFVDWHHARNTRIADFSTVLYHYPFTPLFVDKVREAIETERYTSAAEEYRMYWARIQREPVFKVSSQTARALNHVNDLISNGFLVVTQNYRNWVLRHSMLS